METICKICRNKSINFDTSKILNKYNVNYWYCQICGFVQTDEPFWIDESYTSAIASADTGIMSRNLSNANALLFFLKNKSDGIFMDFGGGHGIFTRIMRDYGFDFYHYDKYAENLFSRGFEADLNKKYTAITSFENFEHFITPLVEIESLLNITDTIIFSTTLINTPPPLVKDWWYYAPTTGQHISFYSYKSLEVIVQKYNLYLQSNKSNLHILSRNPIENKIFNKLEIFNKIKNKLDTTKKYKYKSKCWDDMLKILATQ